MTDKGFYHDFEERYYAPREVIKELRKQYLPFVQPIAAFYPNAPTYDLGCGRGEWLELMLELGFVPFGMDLDEGMLAGCRELGLPASQGNAVDHLKTLEDESQALITAFHVVEHISFVQLQTVVMEAKRVLKPGGLLIMETPNPENIIVATRNFFLDPTHQRIIPPMLLAFVAEYAGFARIKTLRLQESKELVDKNNLSLQDVFSGASPDYALVAQKEGLTELMDALTPAFDAEYGLAFETLADRYQQQMEHKIIQTFDRAAEAITRAAVAEERLRVAEERIEWERKTAETAQEQAEAKAQEAEARAAEIEAREAEARVQMQQALEVAQHAQDLARKAETRAAQYKERARELEATLAATRQELHDVHQSNHHHWQIAEARQKQIQVLEQRIQDLLDSWSWRITAPLRVVSRPIPRLMPSALKPQLKGLVRDAAFFIGRGPALKRMTLRALNRFPNLKSRLERIVVAHYENQVTVETAHDNRHDLANLTPRARQIYADLKAEMAKQKV